MPILIYFLLFSNKTYSDRFDNDVKVFACPVSVWKMCGNYSSNHNFKISRQGHGLSSRYEVNSLGEAPISKELEDQIYITSRAYPIADIFIKKLDWELLNTEPEPINDRFDILDL